MLKQKFNQDWFFRKGGGSSLQSLFGAEDEAQNVTLPHDASVGMTRNPEEQNGSGNGFFREESCNYTKTFGLAEEDREKNVWLEFEGVYQNAYVYVNSSFAGQCPYGYGNFYIDVTKYVKFGELNTVKVVVKNGVPSGRWYTGGGIYRDVNLMIADRMHFLPDGVQLAAVEAEKEQAVIRARTTVEYTGTGVRDITLEIRLLDADGRLAAEGRMPVTVTEHGTQTYQQRLYVENPQLWDEDHPYLYQYHACIREGDRILDEEKGSFGIRKLQLDRAHGLRVNGKVVKLRGGCIHHDNGVTGTAEFAHTAEFRVKSLKNAGYNAIRSSHYPMSRRLLEACDKFGMYVMDEFSDVWTTTKVDFDYGMHMATWWEHDVSNLVRKDYNHPCVIMYSIGNEIPETGNKFDVQWGKKLADRLRELDDSRYVTNSLNLLLSVMDQMPKIMAEIAQKQGLSIDAQTGEGQEINSMMSSMGDMMQLAVTTETAGKLVEEACAQVDITGYNYAAACYELDGIRYPNRIMTGSETNPWDLDVNWALVEKLPYVIGDFAWTAWDYLGEAGIGKFNYGDGDSGLSFYAPYPCKAAYCADFNLIGDRRPSSYWRETVWGLSDKPYLCVQPPQHHGEKKLLTMWILSDAVRSWNWNGYEGKPVTVEAYTTAEEAALFVNGKEVERKAVRDEKKYRVLFETVYQQGILELVVYKNGEECGRDRIVTASDEVRLCVAADSDTLPADGSDIAYVDISLRDSEGNLNPGLVKAVSVAAEGPGVILGFGSADPESEENYFDTTANTFEGRLRAAVRAAGGCGTITVTVSAEGCADAAAEIQAV